MAVEVSCSTSVENLKKALDSALECTDNLKTPFFVEGGISLFDVKNEIFLSYLHNLVFLIILKIRNQKVPQSKQDEALTDSVVKKLVELQVYIDKGVRPLENRLKYQIEKVIRAVDDSKNIAHNQSTKTGEDKTQVHDEDSNEGSDKESEDDVKLNASNIQDLQYRPNPAAFDRSAVSISDEGARGKSAGDVYRPPRIHATSMPTTGSKGNEAKKPSKSATVDEFIYTEMSSIPIAEPSIGTTIVSGGRKNLSEKERNDERERREYEEQNYIRLPTESKKERAKKRGPKRDLGYGGEEWRGLGEGIDRIERLTKKRFGERSSTLEKSRKRSNEDESSEKGTVVGHGFQKRLKRLEKKTDRRR